MQRQCSFCRGRPFHRLVSQPICLKLRWQQPRKLQCLWTEQDSVLFGLLFRCVLNWFDNMWHSCEWAWVKSMTSYQIWNHLLLSPLLLYCQGENFECLWAVYVSTTSHNTITLGFEDCFVCITSILTLLRGFCPADMTDATLRKFIFAPRGSCGSSGRKWVGKRKSAEKDQKSTRLQDSSIAKSFSKGAWLRPMVTARDIDENWSQIPFHEPLQVLCRIYCQAKSRAWCNPIEFRFTYSLQIMQEKHAAFKT
jgi:hypothetical protein